LEERALNILAMAAGCGGQQQRMLDLLVVVIAASGTASSMDIVGKATGAVSDVLGAPEQSTCLLQGSSSRQRLQPTALEGISEASRTTVEKPKDHDDHHKEGKVEKKQSWSDKTHSLEFDPMALMRIELHLQSSLKSIHKSHQGGLPMFLEVLRLELSKAARLPIERISLLGARGSYLKLSQNSLVDVSMLEAEHGESIIDFEVLPGKFYSDRSPHAVFEDLKDTVHDKSSKLMKGPLKGFLHGASVVLGNTLRGPEAAHDGAQRILSCGFHIMTMLALAAPWSFA